jgi:hypothetical protein
VNGKTRKRESGGYEFFYNGWKLEEPNPDNCRFGSDRDNVFPEDRAVQLDAEYLKKWALQRIG